MVDEVKKLDEINPRENLKRNQALWEYHLKHPNTGSTKLGRVFRHRDKKSGKVVPLSPSAVWRILERMKKRYNVVDDSCVEVENGEHK